MKKLLAMALALVMCLGVTTMAWAEEKYDGFTKGETGTNGMDTYSIDVTDQAGLQKAITATDSFGANMVINIKNDITITGEWTPGYLNGYGTNGAGTGVVTVNGNGYKIVGLSSMLFSSVWAGKCGLIVNDLTLENANVEVAKDDSDGATGVGAFVGFAQAATEIRFNNCHLVKSHVEGGHWTGGFVGYAAGYSEQGNGPVFQTVTFSGCTVKESEITGKGSVGALMGHATGDAWTQIDVGGTTVSGNTVTSTGNSTNKAGALFGTTGVAGQETNGKTGGIAVSATVSGNTVKSNETEITTIYGRQGSADGRMELTGGSYDNVPIAESDASWATPSADLAMAEVTAAGGTTYNYGTGYIQAAATAEGVSAVTIKSGDVTLTGVAANVSVKNEGVGTVTVNNNTVNSGDSYTVPQPETPPRYYYNSTTTTTDTKKDDTKTSSPKTFDAGVGVYAVSAILSVTGMAYVGKKKF